MSQFRRRLLPIHLTLLAAALACACGVFAASARAQVAWVVHGHGFGHGVGMSAYGAYGYALKGKSYQFILGHYYPGTTLGSISGPNVVHVLLFTSTVEGDGFDLYSDTRSQVYKGLESEYTTSDQAEEETAGQVLMYEGQVAETLFSACSGGKTESNENVFGAAIPYLVGVPDPYDEACPLHNWTLNFSGPEITQKLSGLLDGALRKVVITKTAYSPRIMEAKLLGTGGVTTVTGEQLEVALGGYSTWMTFEKVVGK